ncbi:RebB family R body protein [Maricaulis sp.]|uniref:RebB family R body protein n=1 Tax=Maricaulis sp. TaxID=1486257 RepID=UPI003A904203
MAGAGTAAWSQAYNQQVNPQVTDSVTQPNVEVVGEAPAMSQGNLYQEESQALSNAAHSATTAQQQTNVTAQAATTMGVPTLDSVDTASTEAATRDIFGATAAEPD